MSLLKLLQKYKELFDGTLGQWNTEPVHIELCEDTKPVSSRYYPVPKIQNDSFHKELYRLLVNIGVLRSSEKGQRSHKTALLVLLLPLAVDKHCKWKHVGTSFTTAAGQYRTSHQEKVLFTLPEFHESIIYHWEFYLDPGKESQDTGYKVLQQGII